MKVFQVNSEDPWFIVVAYNDVKTKFHSLREFFASAAFFLPDARIVVFCDPDAAHQAVRGTPWFVDDILDNYESVLLARTKVSPAPLGSVRLYKPGDEEGTS